MEKSYATMGMTLFNKKKLLKVQTLEFDWFNDDLSYYRD